MKEIALWIAGIAAGLALILLVLWGLRALSSVTTSITVHEPEPGVHCALASTTHGVAIDCWQTGVER